MNLKNLYFHSKADVLRTVNRDLEALNYAVNALPYEDPHMLDLVSRKEHQRQKIIKHIEDREKAFAAAPLETKQATIGHLEGSAAYTEVRPFGLQDYEKTLKYRPEANAVVRPPIVASGRTPVGKLLLSSRLFAPTRCGKGRAKCPEIVLGETKVDGRRCTVKMEGAELTTSHGDAFLGCLDYIRHFDESVTVPVREFLRRIGRNETSGKNHRALLIDLKEMHKATFFMEYEENGRRRVLAEGWRLIEYDVDHVSQGDTLNPQSLMRFRIPARTAVLFGLGNWCPVDIDVRSSMQSPVSKWLYGYVCTAPQGNVSVKELHEMSGCRQTRSQFRSSLNRSLGDLKEQRILVMGSRVGPEDRLHWVRSKPPRVAGMPDQLMRVTATACRSIDGRQPSNDGRRP